MRDEQGNYVPLDDMDFLRREYAEDVAMDPERTPCDYAPLPTWDAIRWQLDHRALYDLYVISTRARMARAATRHTLDGTGAT